MDDNGFDVIVIGGGAAGLSGALTLARARRSVLVLDAGEPRNAPAAGVHGFLTRDGIAPAELVERGAEEVIRYGGTMLRARAVTARRTDGSEGTGFVVGTEDGREFAARRLLVTTGLVDELPDVPGLRERWGRDVLHCPYCHGWEVRDQPLGVLATGPQAVHQALLLRQWSPRVTLFRHTAPDPGDEQRERLAARDIAVVDGQVTALEVTDDELTGVRLASGRVLPLRALAVLPRMVARAGVVTDLGLASVEHPRGVGSQLESDVSGRTPVEGVWVAGNAADVAATVVTAAAGGVTAAAAINADLVEEDTRRAVARRRDRLTPFSATAEARVAELVLGARRHGIA